MVKRLQRRLSDVEQRLRGDGPSGAVVVVILPHNYREPLSEVGGGCVVILARGDEQGAGDELN